MKSHPYADLFPMMTPAELGALAEDVKANGLRQPVVRYQGAVLDGRNRLLACERAGVAPSFTDYEGDDAGALALVISLNVQRRDLTAAQRAVVAARALPAFEATKKPGPKSGTNSAASRARDDAARIFKVGVNAVQQAKALLAEATDLASQVEACALSLAAAYEQLQERRKQARQREKDAQRVAEFTDAISNGEMKVEDALQQAIEQERQQKESEAQEAQARQLWFAELAGILARVEEHIIRRTDEHLAWYTQAGAPGSRTDITPGQIDAAVAGLRRVRSITFGGTDNDVPA